MGSPAGRAGFYFLIDCVATFSLLFDIPEFMALLTGEVSFIFWHSAQPQRRKGESCAARRP